MLGKKPQKNMTKLVKLANGEYYEPLPTGDHSIREYPPEIRKRLKKMFTSLIKKKG